MDPNPEDAAAEEPKKEMAAEPKKEDAGPSKGLGKSVAKGGKGPAPPGGKGAPPPPGSAPYAPGKGKGWSPIVKGPADMPKLPLGRKLHWTPISESKLENTVWAEIQQEHKESGMLGQPQIMQTPCDEGGRERERTEKQSGSKDVSAVWDAKITPRRGLGLDDLERVFKTKNVTKSATSPPRQRGKAQASLVTILDNKRAQNIAIVLAGLGIAAEDLCDRLTTLKTEGLVVDVLEKWQEVMPTEEEVRTLTAYQGDLSLLRDIEKKLIPFCLISRMQQRLKLMTFDLSVPQLTHEIHESVLTVSEAAKQVRSSQGLRWVLSRVLMLGNFVNYGSTIVESPRTKGFSVDSLLRLLEMKSPLHAGVTMLHYLIYRTLRVDSNSKNKELLLDLPKQLHLVGPAARVSVDGIRKQLDHLAAEISVVAAEMKLESKYEANTLKDIQALHIRAEQKHNELTADFHTCENQLLDLVHFFGENPKQRTATDLFKSLQVFVEAWMNAIQDIQRQPSKFERAIHGASKPEVPTRSSSPLENTKAIPMPRLDIEQVVKVVQPELKCLRPRARQTTPSEPHEELNHSVSCTSVTSTKLSHSVSGTSFSSVDSGSEALQDGREFAEATQEDAKPREAPHDESLQLHSDRDPTLSAVLEAAVQLTEKQELGMQMYAEMVTREFADASAEEEALQECNRDLAWSAELESAVQRRDQKDQELCEKLMMGELAEAPEDKVNPGEAPKDDAESAAQKKHEQELAEKLNEEAGNFAEAPKEEAHSAKPPQDNDSDEFWGPFLDDIATPATPTAASMAREFAESRKVEGNVAEPPEEEALKQLNVHPAATPRNRVLTHSAELESATPEHLRVKLHAELVAAITKKQQLVTTVEDQESEPTNKNAGESTNEDPQPSCGSAVLVVAPREAAAGPTTQLKVKAAPEAPIAVASRTYNPLKIISSERIKRTVQLLCCQHSSSSNVDIELFVSIAEAEKKLDCAIGWEEVPIIYQLVSYGAAERHGIRAGDHVLQVNGTETRGQTREQLLSVLQSRPLTLKLGRKDHRGPIAVPKERPLRKVLRWWS